MINNLKCDFCTFRDKCLAKAKLKPFLKDSLRVNLTFDKCLDFKKDESVSGANGAKETETKTE